MCRSKGKTDIPSEEKQRRKSAYQHQTSHLAHREVQSNETSDEYDIYMFHIESTLKSAL